MHTIFVRFLLCLLIGALPLQGYAAATRLGCLHASDIGAPAIQAADAASAAHAAMAHCDNAASTLKQPQPHQHDGGEHSAGHASCGICALGAAAPPPSMFFPRFIDNGAAPAVAPAPLVAGHIPATLERPPRRFPV